MSEIISITNNMRLRILREIQYICTLLKNQANDIIFSKHIFYI